jgi:hypothetical protein
VNVRILASDGWRWRWSFLGVIAVAGLHTILTEYINN